MYMYLSVLAIFLSAKDKLTGNLSIVFNLL